MNLDYIADIIDKQVTEKIDAGNDISDSNLKEIIEACGEKVFERTSLKEEEKLYIVRRIFNGRRRYGVIQPFLEDISVNEIMINGTDEIYIEKSGRIINTGERFRNRDSLYNVIKTMAALSNRTVNESSPIVDGRLDDGSRINAVLYPVALNGPVVTIRKFPQHNFTAEDMVSSGTMTGKEAEFLKQMVVCGMNIFVSGGTSTGKTTFLNMLSDFIPADERVITIEDSAELRLNNKNIVRLETKNPNAEGVGGVTMRQLIKSSLRMRPDRIIIGEVRDESALDMLQALCTGHDGSMSTGHANSTGDMIVRLETMALWEGHISSEAVRRQIAMGVDLIVQLKRDKNMKRYVHEISEVAEYSNGQVVLNCLFRQGIRVGTLTKKKHKTERQLS
ncbi:MAG: CpaF family protein [Ruminococcaceae bacterium]|nr:CpaF family protein [Oscillospiraceae bacterium]